jgi:hypothetical protein
MRTPKKVARLAQAKAPISSANLLRAVKSKLAVNFSVKEGIDLSESEVSIKVSGREITAQFFVRGELVSQQAVPVKKIPNPPPWPKDEIIKALEQLRINFKVLR